MKNLVRTILLLLTAVLLCTAASYGAVEAPSKDPAPISAESIITPGDQHSFYLNVQKKYPDLELTYSTDPGETALTVDQNGLVTMLTDHSGTYPIFVTSAETDVAQECTIMIRIFIPMKDQQVTGASKVSAVFGKPVQLKVSAKTHLTYRSENKSIATVDASGKVTFLRPGKVLIVAVADVDDVYMSNCLVITVTSKLGKPALKAAAAKRKVRLRWTKVPRAQKYLVYCKYPGKKKYKLAATTLPTVKGISHKNLKKGKKYKYKVRAYMTIGGKKYYGPYSKPVTVKIP